MARISTAQFETFCSSFGKDKFIRRPVDISPGRKPMKNKELCDILEWLDKQCEEPYYVTKERRIKHNPTADIVFYFMSDQDSMVFSLCYFEICK